MRFSKQTQCFYPEDIDYPSLPSDIVTVTQADFDLAMSRATGETLNVVNGSIVIVQAPVPTFAQIKARQWEAIKAERDRRTETGGYLSGTKWFHSDQKSRSQQLGLVLLGANIPAGLQWKTMDGTFVTMTQQLAGQILGAAAASDQAIFAAAETHKAAMEASADPAIYDFSTGWPKVFGEL